jgi:hypothetical protein
MLRLSIDFDVVFTRVMRLQFIWLLFALIIHEEWLINHMEVKSMLLNGVL